MGDYSTPLSFGIVIVLAFLKHDFFYSWVLRFSRFIRGAIYGAKFMAPHYGVNKVEMLTFHSHHTERVVKNDFFLPIHLSVGQKGIWSEKLTLARQMKIDSGCAGITLIIGGVRFECSVFSLESHKFFFLG
jgi:hypothetical protein